MKTRSLSHRFLATLLAGVLLSQACFAHLPEQNLLSVRLAPTIPKGLLEHVRVKAPRLQNNQPIVYLLQDIHLNEEAQRSMAAALETLIREDKNLVVGVEGSYGPFDYAPYKKLTRQDVVKKIAENYLVKGWIQAASYAALTSNLKNAHLIGLEDAALYSENVNAYRNAMEQKEKLEKELARREQESNTEIATLKKPLRAFAENQRNYHNGKTSLGEYLAVIPAEAGIQSFNLETFLAAYEMEKKIDFDRVEKERANILEVLSGRISGHDVTLLKEATASYQASHIALAEYYRFVSSLIEKNGINLARFPAFNDYLRYLFLSDGVDVDQVFADLKKAEDNSLQALKPTAGETQILNRLKLVLLTRKLSMFSLTAEEWSEYRALTPSPLPEPGEGRVMAFENFYRAAEKRNEALVKNFGSAKTGVVIAGGFHTAALQKLFQQKGYATVVLTPRVTKLTNAPAGDYLSVFLKEKSPLQKLFSGRKLFLAIPDSLINVQPQTESPRDVKKLFDGDYHKLSGEKGSPIFMAFFNFRQIFRNWLAKKEFPIIDYEAIKARGNNSLSWRFRYLVGPADGVAYSPDNKWRVQFYYQGGNTRIDVYNVLNDKKTYSFDSPAKQVEKIFFSPDGKKIAIGGENGTVYLTKINKKGETLLLGSAANLPISRVSFNSDGSRITALVGQLIYVWDTANGEMVRTFNDSGQTLVAVGFSADDEQVFSISKKGRQTFYWLDTGEIDSVLGQIPLEAMGEFFTASIQQNPMREAVVSGSKALAALLYQRLDGTYKITLQNTLNLSSDILAEIEIADGAAQSLALNPDGTRLALIVDGQVREYDLPTIPVKKKRSWRRWMHMRRGMVALPTFGKSPDEIIPLLTEYKEISSQLLQSVIDLNADHYRSARLNLLAKAREIEKASDQKEVAKLLAKIEVQRVVAGYGEKFPAITAAEIFGLARTEAALTEEMIATAKERLTLFLDSFPPDEKEDVARFKDDIEVVAANGEDLLSEKLADAITLFRDHADESDGKDFLLWQLAGILKVLSDPYPDRVYLDKAKARVVLSPQDDLTVLGSNAIHEFAHALAREKIIDVPSSGEVLTQAITMLDLLRTRGDNAKILEIEEEEGANLFIPEAVKWAKEHPASYEEGIEGFGRVGHRAAEMILENWQRFGFENHSDALDLLHESQDYFERQSGLFLGAILHARHKDTPQTDDNPYPPFRALIEYANTTLHLVTEDEAEQIHFDPEKEKRIVAEIRAEVETQTGLQNVIVKPWEAKFDTDTPYWRFTPPIKRYIKADEPAVLEYASRDIFHPDESITRLRALTHARVAVEAQHRHLEADVAENGTFLLLLGTVSLTRAEKYLAGRYPGLAEVFAKLNKVLYPNPKSAPAKSRFAKLPFYVQYLEAILYRARLGQNDPRVQSTDVKAAIGQTLGAWDGLLDAEALIAQAKEVLRNDFSNSRPSIDEVNAQIMRIVYQTVKKEIWPVLQKLYDASEHAALAQEMWEQKNENGDRFENVIKKLKDQVRQEFLDKLAKDARDLPDEERKNLAAKAKEKMQQQEKQFADQLKEAGREAQKALEKALQQLSQFNQLGDLKKDVGQMNKQVPPVKDAAKGMENLSQQIQQAAQDIAQKAGTPNQDSEAGEALQQMAKDLLQQASELKQKTDQLKQSGNNIKDKANQLGQDTEVQENAEEISKLADQTQEASDELNQAAQALQNQLSSSGEGDGETDTPGVRSKARGVEQGGNEVEKATNNIQDKAGELSKTLGQLSEAIQQAQEALGNSEIATGPPDPRNDSQDAAPENVIASEAKQSQETNDGSSDELDSDLLSDLASLTKAPAAGKNSNKEIENAKEQRRKAQQEADAAARAGFEINEWRWWQEFLKPVKGVSETLFGRFEERLRGAIVAKTLNRLPSGTRITQEDLYRVMTDGRLFETDLVPASLKLLMMLLVDASGSMGNPNDKTSKFYQTGQAFAAIMMAFIKLKRESVFKDYFDFDAEIRAYAERKNIPIFPFGTQLTEHALYVAIKNIFTITGRGGTADVPTFTDGAAALVKQANGDPEAGLGLINVTDGNLVSNAPYIKDVYNDPKNKRTEFLSGGVGDDADTVVPVYESDEHKNVSAFHVANPAELRTNILKYGVRMFERMLDSAVSSQWALLIIGTALLTLYDSRWGVVCAAVVAIAGAPKMAPKVYDIRQINGVPHFVMWDKRGQEVSLPIRQDTAGSGHLPIVTAINDDTVKLTIGGHSRRVKLHQTFVNEMVKMMKIINNIDPGSTNLSLTGHKSTGKNTAVYVLAGFLKQPVRTISLHAHTTEADLRWKMTVGTKKAFTTDRVLGEYYAAADSNDWIVVDEATKVIKQGTLTSLNAMNQNRRDTLPDGTHVIAKPTFRAFFLWNPPGGIYRGQDPSRIADFLSRLRGVEFIYPTRNEETELLMESVFGGDTDQVKSQYRDVVHALTGVADEIRKYADSPAGEGMRVPPIDTRQLQRTLRQVRHFKKDLAYLRDIFLLDYPLSAIPEDDRDVYAQRVNGWLNDYLGKGKFDKHYYNNAWEAKVDPGFPVVDEERNVVIFGNDTVGKFELPRGNLPLDEIEVREFIDTPENRLDLWMLAKDLVLGNNNALLGEMGTGKTEMTLFLHRGLLRWNMEKVQVTPEMRGEDVLGTHELFEGQSKFPDPPLKKAMQEGRRIFYDEVTKAGPDVAAAWHNVAEFSFATFTSGDEQSAEPGFGMTFAGNLATGHTQAQNFSAEFASRVRIYWRKPLTRERLVLLLKADAEKLKKMAAEQNKTWHDIDDAVIDGIAHTFINLQEAYNRQDLRVPPQFRSAHALLQRLGQYPKDAADIDDVLLEDLIINNREHKENAKKEMWPLAAVRLHAEAKHYGENHSLTPGLSNALGKTLGQLALDAGTGVFPFVPGNTHVQNVVESLSVGKVFSRPELVVAVAGALGISDTPTKAHIASAVDKADLLSAINVEARELAISTLQASIKEAAQENSLDFDEATGKSFDGFTETLVDAVRAGEITVVPTVAQIKKAVGNLTPAKVETVRAKPADAFAADLGVHGKGEIETLGKLMEKAGVTKSITDRADEVRDFDIVRFWAVVKDTWKESKLDDVIYGPVLMPFFLKLADWRKDGTLEKFPPDSVLKNLLSSLVLKGATPVVNELFESMNIAGQLQAIEMQKNFGVEEGFAKDVWNALQEKWAALTDDLKNEVVAEWNSKFPTQVASVAPNISTPFRKHFESIRKNILEPEVLAVSPDGLYAVVVGANSSGVVRLYVIRPAALSTDQLLYLSSFQSKPMISFSPDSKLMVLYNNDVYAVVFRLSDMKSLGHTHTFPANASAVSVNNNGIVGVGDEKGQISFLDFKNPMTTALSVDPFIHPISAMLAVDEDESPIEILAADIKGNRSVNETKYLFVDEKITSIGNGLGVRVYGTEKGNVYYLGMHQEAVLIGTQEGAVKSLLINSDRKTVTSVAADGTFSEWPIHASIPLNSSEPLKSLLSAIKQKNNKVGSVVISPDGTRAAVAELQKQTILVHIVDLKDQTIVVGSTEYTGTSEKILLNFSPDSQHLVMAFDQNHVKVFGLDGVLFNGTTHMSSNISAVAINKAGLVGTTEGSTVCLWDATKLNKVVGKNVPTQLGNITALTFSAQSSFFNAMDDTGNRQLYSTDVDRFVAHPKSIFLEEATAVLENGMYTVYGTKSGNVYLNDGHQKHIGTQNGPVTSLAVSADGKTVTSAAPDGTFYKWAVDTKTSLSPAEVLRKYVDKLKVKNSSIVNLAVSPNSRYAAVIKYEGGMEADLDLIDLQSGNIIKTDFHYAIHNANKPVLNFSPNSESLIVGLNNWAHVINSADGKTKNSTSKFDATIAAVAVSNDGWVTVAQANKMEMWNSSDPNAQPVLVETTLKNILSFYEVKEFVSAIDDTGEIALVPNGGGQVSYPTAVRSDKFPTSATCALINPADNTIAVGTKDGDVYINQKKQGDEFKRIGSQNGAPVKSLMFSADGKTITSVALDGTFYEWPINDSLANTTNAKWQELLRALQVDRDIQAIVIRPDGKYAAIVAVERRDGKTASITMVKMDDNMQPHTIDLSLPMPKSSEVKIAFSPNSIWIAVGFDDHVVTIKAPDGKAIDSYAKMSSKFSAIAISDDGLVAGGNGSEIDFWDAVNSSAQAKDSKTTDLEDISALSFQGGGELITAFDGNGNEQIHVLNEDSKFDMEKKVSGKITAVIEDTSADNNVYVTEQGKIYFQQGIDAVREIGEHDGPVTSLAFNDNETIVTAMGSDGTMSKWPVEGSGLVPLPAAVTRHNFLQVLWQRLLPHLSKLGTFVSDVLPTPTSIETPFNKIPRVDFDDIRLFTFVAGEMTFIRKESNRWQLYQETLLGTREVTFLPKEIPVDAIPTTMTFTKDGKIGAIGFSDATIVSNFFPNAGWTIVRMGVPTRYSISALALSDGGTLLFSGSGQTLERYTHVRGSRTTSANYTSDIETMAIVDDKIIVGGKNHFPKTWPIDDVHATPTEFKDYGPFHQIIKTENRVFFVKEDGLRIKKKDAKTFVDTIELAAPAQIPLIKVAIHPDEKTFASLHEGNVISVWAHEDDVARAIQQIVLNQPIKHLEFSPDGKSLVLLTESGELLKLDGSFTQVEEKHPEPVLHTFKGENWLGAVNTMALSPDGKYLAVGVTRNYKQDKTAVDEEMVSVFELSTGKIVRTLLGNGGDLRKLTFSNNGIHLGVVDSANEITIWDLLDKVTPLVRFEPYEYDHIETIAFGHDVRDFAASIFGVSIQIETLNTAFSRDRGSIGKIETKTQGIRDMVYTADRKTLIAFGNDGNDHVNKIFVCDLQSKDVRRIDVPNLSYDEIALSPDDRLLAVTDTSHNIIVLDWKTSDVVATLSGHNADIESLAFSPDSQNLASGSSNGELRYWNIRDQKLVDESNVHARAVKSLVFSADGQTIYSGSIDKTVRIWPLKQTEPNTQIHGPESNLDSIDWQNIVVRSIIKNGDPIPGKSKQVWKILGDACLSSDGRHGWVRVQLDNLPQIVSFDWDGTTVSNVKTVIKDGDPIPGMPKQKWFIPGDAAFSPDRRQGWVKVGISGVSHVVVFDWDGTTASNARTAIKTGDPIPGMPNEYWEMMGNASFAPQRNQGWVWIMLKGKMQLVVFDWNGTTVSNVRPTIKFGEPIPGMNKYTWDIRGDVHFSEDGRNGWVWILLDAKRQLVVFDWDGTTVANVRPVIKEGDPIPNMHGKVWDIEGTSFIPNAHHGSLRVKIDDKEQIVMVDWSHQLNPNNVSDIPIVNTITGYWKDLLFLLRQFMKGFAAPELVEEEVATKKTETDFNAINWSDIKVTPFIKVGDPIPGMEGKHFEFVPQHFKIAADNAHGWMRVLMDSHSQILFFDWDKDTKTMSNSRPLIRNGDPIPDMPGQTWNVSGLPDFTANGKVGWVECLVSGSYQVLVFDFDKNTNEISNVKFQAVIRGGDAIPGMPDKIWHVIGDPKLSFDGRHAWIEVRLDGQLQHLALDLSEDSKQILAARPLIKHDDPIPGLPGELWSLLGDLAIAPDGAHGAMRAGFDHKVQVLLFDWGQAAHTVSNVKPILSDGYVPGSPGHQWHIFKTPEFSPDGLSGFVYVSVDGVDQIALLDWSHQFTAPVIASHSEGFFADWSKAKSELYLEADNLESKARLSSDGTELLTMDMGRTVWSSLRDSSEGTFGDRHKLEVNWGVLKGADPHFKETPYILETPHGRQLFGLVESIPGRVEVMNFVWVGTKGVWQNPEIVMTNGDKFSDYTSKNNNLNVTSVSAVNAPTGTQLVFVNEYVKFSVIYFVEWDSDGRVLKNYIPNNSTVNRLVGFGGIPGLKKRIEWKLKNPGAPSFSADGTQLVINRPMSSGSELYVSPWDGRGPISARDFSEPVTPLNLKQMSLEGAPDLTPDGKQMVITRKVRGKTRVEVLTLPGAYAAVSKPVAPNIGNSSTADILRGLTSDVLEKAAVPLNIPKDIADRFEWQISDNWFLLNSGSDETSFYIYDFSKGAMIHELAGFEKKSLLTGGYVLDENKTHIALFGENGEVGVWNIKTGELLFHENFNDQEEYQLFAISPRGTTFSSVNDDLRLSWLRLGMDQSFDDLEPLAERLNQMVSRVRYSPHGHNLAVSGRNDGRAIIRVVEFRGQMEVFDLMSRKKDSRFEEFIFSPNSTKIVAREISKNGNYITIWDLETKRSKSFPYNNNVRDFLGFIDGGKVLVVKNENGDAGETLSFFDIESGETLFTYEPSPVDSYLFFDPESMMLTVHSSADFRRINLKAEEREQRSLPSTGRSNLELWKKLIALVANLPRPDKLVLPLLAKQVTDVEMTQLDFIKLGNNESLADLAVLSLQKDKVAVVITEAALNRSKVVIYDLKTKQKLKHFGWGNAPVKSMAFSPDGNNFVYVRENTIETWLPGGTGFEKSGSRYYVKDVEAVTWISNHVFAASRGKDVVFYMTTQLASIQGHDKVTALACDGVYLAVKYLDSQVRIYDVNDKTKAPILRPKLTAGMVFYDDLAESLNNPTAPANSDSVIEWAHPETGNKMAVTKEGKLRESPLRPSDYAGQVPRSSKSEAGIDEAKLKVLKPNDIKPIEVEFDRPVTAWKIHPKGEWVAVGLVCTHDFQSPAWLYNLITGQKIELTINGGGDPGKVVSIKFNADGSKVVAADLLGRTWMWDLNDRNIFSTSPPKLFAALSWTWPVITNIEIVGDVVFANKWEKSQRPPANGKSTLLRYDLSQGKPLADMKLPEQYDWGMVFSPDGKLLATADDKGVVRLFDAADGTPLGGLPAVLGMAISVIKFSSDGKKLVVGTNDNKDANLSDKQIVVIVDISDPKKSHEILPRVTTPDAVTLVSFSPNDEHFFSGDLGLGTFWQQREEVATIGIDPPLPPARDIFYGPSDITLLAGKEGAKKITVATLPNVMKTIPVSSPLSNDAITDGPLGFGFVLVPLLLVGVSVPILGATILVWVGAFLAVKGILRLRRHKDIQMPRVEKVGISDLGEPAYIQNKPAKDFAHKLNIVESKSAPSKKAEIRLINGKPEAFIYVGSPRKGEPSIDMAKIIEDAFQTKSFPAEFKTALKTKKLDIRVAAVTRAWTSSPVIVVDGVEIEMTSLFIRIFSTIQDIGRFLQNLINAAHEAQKAA